MTWTKEEMATYQCAYAATHWRDRRAYNRTWTETHQDERRAYLHAYHKAHLEERAANSRAWREAHRDDRRDYDHVYQKTHRQESAERCRRRRALLCGATVGPIDLAAIRQRDRMMCCICGRKVIEKDLSFDHTIPLSLGGPHTQENLRVAHRRCNSRRCAGRVPVQMVLC